jgi:signal transduction histidine kinase/ligand-binding sensor domain-containing protein
MRTATFMTSLAAALVLSLAISAAASTDAGTRYTVTTWTEKDGLPSSQVRAIVQTGDGFLWLATSAGVVRFDGVTFTSNIAGVPDGDVTVICAARDGGLWIAFDDGRMAHLLNGRVDSFGPDPSVSGSLFTQMVEDTSGNLWVGGRSGLFRFTRGHWRRMTREDGFTAVTVTSLYVDRAGELLVGSIAPGVLMMKPGADHFESIPSNPRIHGIGEDAAGAIWVADHVRAFRLLRGTPALPLPTVGSEATYGYRVIHDRVGALWVATQGDGLMRMTATRGSQDVARFTTRDGLAHNVIGSLIEDSEGNVWVGTSGGLSRVSQGAFSALRTSGGQNTSLTAASDGSVWVATAEGLIRFHEGRRTQYSEADGLPSNYTATVFEDPHAGIWVGTDHGIARLTNGRFVQVPFPERFPLGLIHAITMTPDGELVFHDLDRGLFRLRDGHVRAFDGALAHKLGHFAIVDSQGTLWFGFQDGGVARVDNDSGGVRLFDSQDGLASGHVNAFFEHRGTLWVATNKGVSRLDRATQRFVTLPLARLHAASVTTATADDQGFLWIAVNSGILRVSIAEFEKAAGDPTHPLDFRSYDATDGAPGSPVLVLGQGAVRATDGTVWIATGEGIAVIDPKRLPVRRVPPAVVIGGVLADQRALSPTSGVRVGPGVSRLQIDYTALTLNASWIRFRYMLDGFDNTWVDVGTNRRALFTNLRPGDYRFRISAANKDGIWSEPAEWAFAIAPAFYQTRSFYAVSTIAALVVLWAVWQLRLRAVQRRIVLVYSERSRMAREIHDTLLQSLVGVALQLGTISDKPAATAIRDQLAVLRKQVEGFIREARQSIWNLRSPALAVNDLPTALRDAGAALTIGSDIRFEVVVVGKPLRFAPRVEEQLLRIGQEAVSNAVRHANATVICLELRYTDDSVVLRISDDGCGFDPAVAHAVGNHWGLKSMQERAEQIGGCLTLLTKPGEGTILETSAPVTNAA